MSGSGVVGNNPNKIKGGRWTVFRFFLVSIAHSIPWFTVSSLLSYYAVLFGPQILLMMNIAYYLPSIPLLIFSAACDDWLDLKFGVPRVILARLLFGLGGCTVICAAFPFVVNTARSLLLLIVILGLVSAIAFSSSYQLVARFANKSVIALGLGCVGSGIVVLLLELAVGMKTRPTTSELIWLFELTAGLVLAGAAASVSLLLRHWRAIEAWSAEPATGAGGGDAAEPLLWQEEGLEERERHGLAVGLQRRMSTPLLLNYSPLDFMEQLSEGGAFSGEPFLYSSGGSTHGRSGSLDQWSRGVRSKGVSLRRAASEQPLSMSERTLKAKLASSALTQQQQQQEWRPALTPVGGSTPEALLSPKSSPPASVAPSPADNTASHSGHAGSVGSVVLQCWPVLGALFFSGTFFVLAFPFFTYVPSGGTFGQDLPKVLFFSRLAADVCGRTLPRVKRLAIKSCYVLFSFGLIMTVSIPGYLYYIKQTAWHNDWFVIGYIVLMWILGGYVNTCSYVLAPACVDPHLKATANGVLAITYQTAHCTGLILATIIAAVLFGGIAPI
ncbi:hypothetical protein WJX75_001248 [Coccomyxa subellipsoidea]|uniref:MFS general substrate transporter n=1 Tax=Coccomyxa subellipsoidea TaxID=248742 RepID=A0ABR2YIY1_9CHLO